MIGVVLLGVLFDRPGAVTDFESCTDVPDDPSAAGSGEPPSGRGFLVQVLQRQAHRVVNIGIAEAGAAKLQLGDEAPEEDAALLRR